MTPTLAALYVLATEGGIPASDWRAKIAVPLGILIFVGSVYLLLRSNLGTRRGYLVLGTSLWGFMVIYALFWTVGAPGTPPATGPQSLPGQELDAYQNVWRPFAGDSNLANDANYSVVKSFPEGFGAVPANFLPTANTGAADIQTFFSSNAGLREKPVGQDWVVVPDSIRYTTSANGQPLIGATFQETFQAPAEGEEPEGEVGAINPDGETYTAFAFFDAGSPLFPSLVMLGLVSLLFVLHAALLYRDEGKERQARERTSEDQEEGRLVPAGR
jgi:hypothetical protein